MSQPNYYIDRNPTGGLDHFTHARSLLSQVSGKTVLVQGLGVGAPVLLSRPISTEPLALATSSVPATIVPRSTIARLRCSVCRFIRYTTDKTST